MRRPFSSWKIFFRSLGFKPRRATTGQIRKQWLFSTIFEQLEPRHMLAVDIEILDASLSEDMGTMLFDVQLSESSAQTVTVDFATADGSAIVDSDYTGQTGTLTFLPNETLQSISVPILDDTVNELDENFFINLSNATGGATIFDNQAEGTIHDDDPLNTPQWLTTIGSRRRTTSRFCITCSSTTRMPTGILFRSRATRKAPAARS